MADLATQLDEEPWYSGFQLTIPFILFLVPFFPVWGKEWGFSVSAAYRAEQPLPWLPLLAEPQPGNTFLTPTALQFPPGKKHTFKPHYLAKYKPQGERHFIFVWLSLPVNIELAFQSPGK